MKISLLNVLACPVCRKSLEFEGTVSSDRIVNGLLHCLNKHLYQVKDEIPILKDPRLSGGEFSWKVEFPNIQRYEEIQRQYASYLSEEQREADKAMMDEMAKNASKERLVLDVASGMGRLLQVLSQRLSSETNLLGTDVDEKPLRGAKLKLESQKSYDRISLCAMDGKHLAVKPQKIGCVTSYFGLDNIPDAKEAFEELSRVLVRRSRLAMATLWLREGSKSLNLAEKHGHGAIGTENRLIETLDQTGFKIDSVKTFHSGKWPYNPMDLVPMTGDWFAHTLVLAHRS